MSAFLLHHFSDNKIENNVERLRCTLKCKTRPDEIHKLLFLGLSKFQVAFCSVESYDCTRTYCCIATFYRKV